VEPGSLAAAVPETALLEPASVLVHRSCGEFRDGERAKAWLRG